MSAIMTVPSTTEKTVVAPQRVQSVDVLRGLTIALMILVNDPGDWGHVFRPLDHAEWNGWTLTDMVFPTFLFLMGASMVFSLASRTAKGNCWKTLTGHIFSRTGKILLLQFLLVFFPRMQWNGMRVYGVLTRIALCYLLAGLVLVAVLRIQRSKTRVYVLVGIVAAVLVGYWVVLRWVPVPGIGVPGKSIGFLDENANMTSWVDRAVSRWSMHWLHVGRLYKKTRDPEGLLSTLPAVATVLLGALAGIWMRRRDGIRRMQIGLAAAGLLGFVAGEVWSVWFPVNKNLWTSSYVLVSAGLAAMALAGLSWLMDAREEPWPAWLRAATWPWFVFGSNAIAAFTVSVVLVKALLHYYVTDPDGYRNSYWTWVYEHVFARDVSTEWTSLAFAVAFVAVCFLPNWWLWRKKWFLKI